MACRQTDKRPSYPVWLKETDFFDV